MFWETKLAELQKLAPVELVEAGAGGWKASMNVALNRPFEKGIKLLAYGITRAATICVLWSTIVKGNEPFTMADAERSRMWRWNGRWEEVVPPPEEAPDAPTDAEVRDIVELDDPSAFDPAD